MLFRALGYLALLGTIIGLGNLRAAELLKDPADPKSWVMEVWGGAEATVREDHGALRFDVTKVTEKEWNVQTYQLLKGLKQNGKYTLRFSVKASAPRKMALSSQVAEPPWTQVIPWRAPYEIGTEWKDYELPLQFDAVDGKEVRVPMFIMGFTTGTMWVRNVSLDDGAQAAAPAPPAQAAGAPAPAGEELLKDPTQPESWGLQQSEGGTAKLTHEDDALRIQITGGGEHPWSVQMFQVPPKMARPGAYTLLVSMKASAPRKVAFIVQHNGGKYETLLPMTDLNVGTEWKQYKVRFNLKTAFPGANRAPQFLLGGTTGDIWIRSISLTGPEDARK